MVNQPLSGREIQAVQLMVTVTVAVVIGLRFVPPRFRGKIGLALTIAYWAGAAAFVIYLLLR